MAIKLGLDGKLYRNTGNYATPVWNEIPNVKDLSTNLDKALADVTTRANGGWRAEQPTLKTGTVEFGMVWDSTDEDVDYLGDSFFNNSTIEFAVMDGLVNTNTSQGLRATMGVQNFTRTENLEEAMMVNVSLKPAYSANAPSWMTGS